MNDLFENSEGKLLTFLLGTQEYGIKILEAREVVGMMHIDPVPHTSDFMKGVINLRGNAFTGIIVDFLIGVTRIEEVSFEETPQMSANIRAEFISGMAKLEDRVVIVLELKNVLSAKAMVSIPTNQPEIAL